MTFRTIMHSAMAIGLASSMAACAPPAPQSYNGPGCLIYVYAFPNLQGYALPVRQDAEELSAMWSKSAASAQVVYGTWRLYTQPHYKGFMGDYKARADIMRLKPMHKLGSLECIMPQPAPPPPPGY